MGKHQALINKIKILKSLRESDTTRFLNTLEEKLISCQNQLEVLEALLEDSSPTPD